MPTIYEHLHTVTAAEIDGVGHVNNVEYLRWLQDAAIAHSAVQGWPPARHRELGHGWVVRSHSIEYRLPAYEGDQLVVRTWVASLARVTSLRRYEIIRRSDSAVLVTASTNWAYVYFDGHRPCRIPAEVATAFEVVLDAE